MSATAWDLITQYCALGVRIQTSGSRDGFGFTPGAPHADALVVADAIKSMSRDVTFADRLEVEPLFGDLLPIADSAVGALLLTRFDQQSLVISHAMLRTQPPWDFDLPTPYQRFAPTTGGRPRAIVHGIDEAGDLIEVKPSPKDGKFKLSQAPRSPVEWLNPSVLQIGECRGEYFAWRAGLVSLAADLVDKLNAYEPLPPAAVYMPWIAGVVPSRVLPTRNVADQQREGDKMREVPVAAV